MSHNKNAWLAVALVSGLTLAACSQTAVKQAPAPAPLAAAINKAVIQKSPNDDRSYAAILLPNQLQVVLVSDPTLEVSAASLAVGIGSAQDPDSQPGLAHYLEHMLFLGTKKYPIPDNFFEFVQTSGGMTNAFTAGDKTNFLFKINAGKFDEALDRYSDYFKAPLLDPQFADKERNAVNSEWSMDKSQDNWIVHALDAVTANPENPYSRFSIGNLETLVDKKDSKLQTELKAFYDRYYSANNMKLTLVGKQSIPELKALAEKYFADIPNKNVERPKVTVPGLTKAQLGKSIHYQPQQDLKQVLVDFPLKDNKEQWRLKPNEYVGNLLGSEEEGTLCEQLRKQGLANNVMVGFSADEYGSDGYLRIHVDLTDAGLAARDQVVASVLAYVDLVKKQGLNEKYFRELQAMRAKDFLNASKPDPLKQAVELTNSQFELPVENLLNAPFIYDHFDQAAIQSVLDQLKPEDVRVWYINKNEAVDKTIPYFDGKYSIRDITQEERAKWASLANKIAFNLPAENNLFTDKPADIVANTYLKPHQVVSQKGAEAFLVQPEFYREDKGVLNLEVNVDFARKSPKNVVLANLLNDIYKINNTTLLDRAERASLGLNIMPTATGSQGFFISGYTTKHQELLKTLLTGFANFSVDQNEFADVLDKYKRNLLNNKKAIPLRQGFAQLNRLLGETHWTDEDLLAAANKVTRADLVAYHKAVKADPLIRLFAFGNYSEQQVQEFVKIATTALPGKRVPEQRKIASFIAPKVGQQLTHKAVVEQADDAVIEGFWGDKKSDDEMAQLQVLNALFGNVFFNQLRTNEQLGYIVGSTPFPVDERPGFAIYVQSTNTDPTQVKARMDRFIKEFSDQLKAMEPAQIEQVKKAEIANILQKPTDFYKEAKRYENDFWNARYDFTARDRLVAALEKVNKESLLAIYKKMLLDKQAMTAVIQGKGTNFTDKPFAP